jgi:hypothetical protein
VTSEQHDKAHLMAEALGISVSALLAELVDRTEIDETGNPGWQSRYAQQSAPDLFAPDAVSLSA